MISNKPVSHVSGGLKFVLALMFIRFLFQFSIKFNYHMYINVVKGTGSKKFHINNNLNQQLEMILRLKTTTSNI